MEQSFVALEVSGHPELVEFPLEFSLPMIAFFEGTCLPLVLELTMDLSPSRFPAALALRRAMVLFLPHFPRLTLPHWVSLQVQSIATPRPRTNFVTSPLLASRLATTLSCPLYLFRGEREFFSLW